MNGLPYYGKGAGPYPYYLPGKGLRFATTKERIICLCRGPYPLPPTLPLPLLL